MLFTLQQFLPSPRNGTKVEMHLDYAVPWESLGSVGSVLSLFHDRRELFFVWKARRELKLECEDERNLLPMSKACNIVT